MGTKGHSKMTKLTDTSDTLTIIPGLPWSDDLYLGQVRGLEVRLYTMNRSLCNALTIAAQTCVYVCL